MNSDTIFRAAISTLLIEIFDGPPGSAAFVLNPGDQGLLNQLDSLSAATASTRPMPGHTTVAAHADHVEYGMSLLNRWIDGDPNPWATADWNLSWQRITVTDDQWHALRQRFRNTVKHWQEGFARRADWDEISAAGALASVAHTAYHLGAIRQILAAMNANTAPG